ncbi:MAG: hypothetical protein C4527_26675 [Candidatus Omnitrophota bacterium]|jgi:hypothetical protein|nr:MAG: hypothetical protein C4527_26675 [Candidatus Omnitrophota bacterium]
MKPFMWIPFVALLALSCTDNKGKLVDKTTTDSPSNTTATTESLPAGHPPIAQIPLLGQTAASLNPAGPGSLKIDGTTASVAALSFEIDPSWIAETPSSSFRAAQFRIPPMEGESEPAELALFQGIGGTAEQNIQRWIDQFRQPDGKSSSDVAHIDKQQINGLNIQILDISGVFSAGMMGGDGSKEGVRMLAAVVEGPGGPWHFKLTGSEKTVSRWKSSFEALIVSIKPTNG